MATQKIIHADAREALAYLNPDRPIDCIITDPPYGANFWSRRAETPEGKSRVAKIENDGNVTDAIALFHEVMVPLVDHMDEGDIYVFTRWDIVDVWMDAVKALPGVQYKMLLIWQKGYPGMGDIDSNWGCGHELILYCKKGRREVAFRRSGIIAVDKVHTTGHIHPTEKPVPLLEQLINMSTKRGDLVVDPFSGSGSTAVAAQRTGRDAFGFELDERYIKPSRARLEQLAMDLG